MAVDRAPPDRAVPRFPRPRKIEAPSPYRAKLPGGGAPPEERARVVVTRPEPPAPVSSAPGRAPVRHWPPPPPAPPVPWGPSDRVLAVLRPFRDAATGSPYLLGTLLIVFLSALVFSFLSSFFGSRGFVG